MITFTVSPYSPGPLIFSSSRNTRAASYAFSISGPVWRKSSGETRTGSGPCKYTTGTSVATSGASRTAWDRMVTITV